MKAQRLKLTGWTDTLSVGVDALDRDHQKLFRLIKGIHDRMETVSGQNRNAIEALIREVVDYTDYHFRREELLMDVCKYPYLENHHQVHALMQEKTIGFLREYQQESTASVPGEFIVFLENWLTDHIMGMDKSYRSWMEGKNEIIEKALAGLT